MTDMISSLADSIIALINSKPASPTKEEVDAVLRLPITTAMDAHMLSSYPIMSLPYRDPSATLMKLCQEARSDFASVTGIDRLPKADCQEETAQPKPGHCAHYPRGIHPFDVNPPCVACGSLYREWGSTTCLGPKADQDAMAASAASHSALLRSSAQFSENMERRAVEIFNDLPEGSVCCPGSTDGSHLWTLMLEGGPIGSGPIYRCVCGARKS